MGYEEFVAETDTTISGLCSTVGVTYSRGCGFYQLGPKKESINASKVLVVVNTQTGEQIQGQKAREKLGWNSARKVSDSDLPTGYKCFVQVEGKAKRAKTGQERAPAVTDAVLSAEVARLVWLYGRPVAALRRLSKAHLAALSSHACSNALDRYAARGPLSSTMPTKTSISGETPLGPRENNAVIRWNQFVSRARMVYLWTDGYQTEGEYRLSLVSLSSPNERLWDLTVRAGLLHWYRHPIFACASDQFVFVATSKESDASVYVVQKVSLEDGAVLASIEASGGPSQPLVLQERLLMVNSGEGSDNFGELEVFDMDLRKIGGICGSPDATGCVWEGGDLQLLARTLDSAEVQLVYGSKRQACVARGASLHALMDKGKPDSCFAIPILGEDAEEDEGGETHLYSACDGQGRVYVSVNTSGMPNGGCYFFRYDSNKGDLEFPGGEGREPFEDGFNRFYAPVVLAGDFILSCSSEEGHAACYRQSDLSLVWKKEELDEIDDETTAGSMIRVTSDGLYMVVATAWTGSTLGCWRIADGTEMWKLGDDEDEDYGQTKVCVKQPQDYANIWDAALRQLQFAHGSSFYFPARSASHWCVLN